MTHSISRLRSFFILAVLALIAVFLPSYVAASVKVYDGGQAYAYVAPDALANGGITNAQKSGISGRTPSMQRACFLVDPTAYPSYWRTGQYNSPEDNSVIMWEADQKTGTIEWNRHGAKHNPHVKELDCSTDAKADTSLTASHMSIVRGGSSVLTWFSQYGSVRKATCTAENFDLSTFVPGHFESTVSTPLRCPGGSPFDGEPMPNAAATVCGEFIGTVWVPDYTGPAPYSGSKEVSPTETTTYTYSCTNANGTDSSSVTITVLDEPDPSCSDTQDNDHDGVADSQDPDCQSGGPGTEVPHANLPDLTAGAVNETLVPEGSPTTLSSTITNRGDAPTNGGFTNLFQIDNDTDHANVFVTKTDTSPALNNAGGTDLTQVSYTFPSAGTWYVRACADNDAAWHGTITESDENNNCSSGGWKAVTVSSNAPGALLSAAPAEVYSNDASTLTWSCTKSTSASIDHGIGAVKPVDGGSVSTGPLLAQTDYTLTCTGAEGVSHAYTSVRVKTPEVDIKAAPPLVKRGGTTTISWTSVGANACVITGPGISSTAKNDSKTVVINSQSVFTITCNGVSTDTVTVGLVPEFNEQ